MFAEGPVVADANDPSKGQAFFYQSGKKAYLNDTGLAVAELRPGVALGAVELKFPTVNLASHESLAELSELLDKRGKVIVSTVGPKSQSISLIALSADHGDQVEFGLPIVKRADAGPSAAPLVMTEDICARFAATITSEEVDAMASAAGLKVKRKQKFEPNAYVLTLKEGKVRYDRLLRSANALYEAGQADKKVLYVEPDFIVPTKRQWAEATDPLIAGQWHLKNTGANHGVLGADCKALEAWALTTGDPSIKIAIVDDSVEKGHPDLAANFAAGLYFRPDGTTDGDPSPRDGNQRHGTCCAGVATAAHNAVGGRGVAPECRLIGVNFWDVSQPSAVRDAFYFCEQSGAAVISCSWSWNPSLDSVRTAITDLSQNGRNGKGTVFLFAAANDYMPVAIKQLYGTLPEVICVGASNWRDEHSAYSNYGPEVCVVAPSSDFYDVAQSSGILTTDNTDACPKHPGDNFSGYIAGDFTPGDHHQAAFGGTSSATPLVAGICGLMLSVNPALTAKEVREILKMTADKVPGGVTRPAHYDAQGHDDFYGHGRVNALKAVTEAKNRAGGP
jgi:subtilisin family serine protease